MGLSAATVQRAEITHAQVSTLFWINLGMGALLMLLGICFSPLISWFYGDPRLIGVTIGLSSSFLFGGMAVQHLALLRRRMQFVSLAWIGIGSIAGSIIVGIALAWWGMGYRALVLKEVSGAMFGVVGAWLLCHWMPGLPKRKSGVRSILRFGRDVTGFDLIFFLSRSLDQILIGRFWAPPRWGIIGRHIN